ncbi:hypothetical protein Q1695_011589 [Nippostrongylus brasiliensis]|nr:hypothetical protein Q1695_011589 [Nippostrongylus brasiliensis]
MKSGGISPEKIVLQLHRAAYELQSTLFTLIAAIFQGFSLVWFVLSYIPGGERGLRFMTSMCTGFIRKSPTTVLPI